MPDVASHAGLLKVGYTIRTAQIRISEQTKTVAVKTKIVLEASAIRNDGEDIGLYDTVLSSKEYKEEGFVHED